MIDIVLYLSVFFNIFFLFMLRNIYRNNKALRTEVNSVYAEVQQIYANLTVTIKKMREIDQREVFEKNDTVGVIFSELVIVIKALEETFITQKD